jgi:hypothetical protein
MNVVAVHERDFKEYENKKLRVTWGDKPPVEFVVIDYCADKDCGKNDPNCCTNNAKKHANPPFLLDLDSRAVEKNWGVKKPENSFDQALTFEVIGTVAKEDIIKAGAKPDA